MSATQLNKSLSDSNINEAGIESTPPNFISMRNSRVNKRCRVEREQEMHTSPAEPSDFSQFKLYMKELFASFTKTQQQELREINNNLKEMQLTNSNIETSITRLFAQQEEFQKKIESLEVQTKKDREYINILEDKIEDLQRTTRKTCIEIKNVPKNGNENRDDLINMVLCLSKSVNFNMSQQDIKDIYRIQSRKSGVNNTPIIVELASSILKMDLLLKVKSYNIKNKTKIQAKHLGFTKNEETPVFISEQLTSKGARLFFLARDLTKSKEYKFCWTKHGRVFVKKDENSRVILINSEAQVHLLLQET